MTMDSKAKVWLYIWHRFFKTANFNNDITILDAYRLTEMIANETCSLRFEYIIMGVVQNKPCRLIGGIYMKYLYIVHFILYHQKRGRHAIAIGRKNVREF